MLADALADLEQGRAPGLQASHRHARAQGDAQPFVVPGDEAPSLEGGEEHAIVLPGERAQAVERGLVAGANLDPDPGRGHHDGEGIHLHRRADVFAADRQRDRVHGGDAVDGGSEGPPEREVLLDFGAAVSASFIGSVSSLA